MTRVGRFAEAEEEFVRASKPKEAIDMYCHQQDWAAALNVANTYDSASVPAICVLQVGAVSLYPDIHFAARIAVNLCIVSPSLCVIQA